MVEVLKIETKVTVSLGKNSNDGDSGSYKLKR